MSRSLAGFHQILQERVGDYSEVGGSLDFASYSGYLTRDFCSYNIASDVQVKIPGFGLMTS